MSWDWEERLERSWDLWAPVCLERKGVENMKSPEKSTDGEMAVSVWNLELSKQFGEAERVAAKMTHSPKSSEVCRDCSGKDVLYPVVLNWSPFNTQACTYIKTHSLVNFQRTVPAGVWHTTVIKFTVSIINTSCLCSGSLPRGILLPFSFFLSFLLRNLTRPAPEFLLTAPYHRPLGLILHQEEVTLWSAEWRPYLSPVKTGFYCPWLIPSVGK